MSVPNPGSDAAQDLGCSCPVIDNNRGHTPPTPWGFWISDGCPIHAQETPK